MIPFQASPKTHSKIKALLVLAIVSGSEGLRIRSDILVSKYVQPGGSAWNAESAGHGRYDDGPGPLAATVNGSQAALKSPNLRGRGTPFTEAIDAVLTTPRFQEQAGIASQHLKAIAEYPGVVLQSQLLAKQVRALVSDPKVQELLKLATDQMRKLMENRHLQEHVRLASEHPNAMLEDPIFLQQSKLLVERLQAILKDPKLNDQDLHERAGAFSEQLKAIMEGPGFQKHFTLFVEHFESIRKHPEVQQQAKLACEELKAITEDQDFVERASLALRRLKAILENPVLQMHSKLFSQQITDMMADPGVKEWADVPAEQVDAIIKDVATQKYSELFLKGLEAMYADSTFPVREKLSHERLVAGISDKDVEPLNSEPWSLTEMSELHRQKDSMMKFIPVAVGARQRATKIRATAPVRGNSSPGPAMRVAPSRAAPWLMLAKRKSKQRKASKRKSAGTYAGGGRAAAPSSLQSQAADGQLAGDGPSMGAMSGSDPGSSSDPEVPLTGRLDDVFRRAGITPTDGRVQAVSQEPTSPLSKIPKKGQDLLERFFGGGAIIFGTAFLLSGIAVAVEAVCKITDNPLPTALDEFLVQSVEPALTPSLLILFFFSISLGVLKQLQMSSMEAGVLYTEDDD